MFGRSMQRIREGDGCMCVWVCEVECIGGPINLRVDRVEPRLPEDNVQTTQWQHIHAQHVAVCTDAKRYMVNDMHTLTHMTVCQLHWQGGSQRTHT